MLPEYLIGKSHGMQTNKIVFIQFKRNLTKRNGPEPFRIPRDLHHLRVAQNSRPYLKTSSIICESTGKLFPTNIHSHHTINHFHESRILIMRNQGRNSILLVKFSYTVAHVH